VNQVKHFRNMSHVASTWDMQSEIITDSNLEEGRKIITFAHILKHDTMPLARIISDILEVSQQEMRSAVELEFAVDMDVPAGQDKIFSFLQIRQITDSQDNKSLDWDNINVDDSIIYAQKALGVGIIEGITDIIYARADNFDSAHTLEMAEEINIINAKMRDSKRHYVLVGPGRWGSSDPWLGIPIKWPHISEAKVIVECGLKNFRVDPSEGTHFFQNLTSFGIGYLTINPFMGDGRFDIDRLNSMEACYESKYLRQVSFPAPLYIFIDGRKNKGIVRKK